MKKMIDKIHVKACKSVRKHRRECDVTPESKTRVKAGVTSH